MDEGPLENRKLNISVNGIGRLLPALHAEWMMTKEWVTYSPPPDPDTDLHLPRLMEFQSRLMTYPLVNRFSTCFGWNEKFGTGPIPS